MNEEKEMIDKQFKENTLIRKINEYAYMAVIGLVNSELELKGSNIDYLSKENFPMLRTIFFKQLIDEVSEKENDREWMNRDPYDVFEEMVVSGEYAEMVNHPYYALYDEACNGYIDDLNHELSQSRLFFRLLKDLTGELMEVLDQSAALFSSMDGDRTALIFEKVMETLSQKAEEYVTLIQTKYK